MESLKHRLVYCNGMMGDTHGPLYADVGSRVMGARRCRTGCRDPANHSTHSARVHSQLARLITPT